MTYAPLLYRRFFKPRSPNEDVQRREFILNVLLVGSIALAFAAFLLSIESIVRHGHYYALPRLYVVSATMCVFLVIYGLSRKGRVSLAAFIFIFLYHLLATYTMVRWGILIHIGLLLEALVVIMSGILISSRFASIMTGLVVVTLFTIVYFQKYGFIQPDMSWISKAGQVPDAIIFSFVFIVIVLVSWLSNREIERSLQRARRSETALLKERDLLETRVEQRSNELKQAQLEKMLQLYRFAEFGRLASGLFHDLSAPLTTVVLNLEKLSTKERSEMLNRAMEATKHIENFLQAARKQVQNQKQLSLFSPIKEVKQVIQMMQHKTRKQKIRIVVSDTTRTELYGNAIKFHQVITNLLSNAIDAYEEISTGRKEIAITIKKSKHTLRLTVQDWGSGIAEGNIPKIFEPFFTTKAADKGTGIGLAISKDIVEKEFYGTISVKSRKDRGSTFTLLIPLPGKEQ